MEITAMGAILIPLGLILFTIKYKNLIYLTAFFSGFTGSSVINFGNFSLQPSYYFFILFFIRYLIDILRRGSIVKPNISLVIFLFISMLSLFMPIMMEYSDTIVLNPDNYYASIKFTIQNVTQFMYLLFSFLVYWICKDFIKLNKNINEELIKIMLYSTFVISILGIYQEIAYIYSLPFDEIFRSGVHGNVQPYGSFIRVYGVAQEPSMYSIFILMMLIILIYIPKSIFKYKFTLIILLFINGILTTSSTFFIGIIIYIIIYMFTNVNKQNMVNTFKKLGKVTVFSIIFISIMLVFFKLQPQIKNIIIDGTLSKLKGEGLSASSRSYAFIHHIKVALRYPLLGVGFGSIRSYDLFSTWTSSVGLIGVTIFSIFLFRLFIKCVKYNNMIKGYGIAIFVNIICLMISVPEPYFLFIWINIAIVEDLLDKVNLDIEKNIY